MDFPNAAAAIAAAESQLRAVAELTQTAKGQLQLGLTGNPISVTQTQIIFALAMKVTPEHSLEEFAEACRQLMLEGAIDHYRITTHSSNYQVDRDPVTTFGPALDTPVVIAVRRRSAESTRIGPAAN